VKCIIVSSRIQNYSHQNHHGLNTSVILWDRGFESQPTREWISVRGCPARWQRKATAGRSETQLCLELYRMQQQCCTAAPCLHLWCNTRPS
jgi:hypothetical protein